MIRIGLLGRFTVEHDGQEIALGSFGGRLARRLLRLLALRRGTLVLKDLIAEVLWPNDPPADPAGNIEVLVSRIRRALGDRALIRTARAATSWSTAAAAGLTPRRSSRRCRPAGSR